MAQPLNPEQQEIKDGGPVSHTCTDPMNAAVGYWPNCRGCEREAEASEHDMRFCVECLLPFHASEMEMEEQLCHGCFDFFDLVRPTIEDEEDETCRS